MSTSRAPASREAGAWRLDETCTVPHVWVFEPVAWLIAERTLREPDPIGRVFDLTGVSRGTAVLACGLRDAVYRDQAWGHTGDGRQDVWLVSFRRDGDLVALAAIDADTGVVLGFTYGAREE